MVRAYAVTLAVGSLALVAWIFARSYAVNVDRPSLDPEVRWGISGRRVVAALVGFGMAGMSAEFSPRDISWPLALLLAVLGAAGAVWYAGWAGRDEETGPERASGPAGPSGSGDTGEPDQHGGT